MKPILRPVIAFLMVLVLVSLACDISIPSGDVMDSAATSVAGTVNALAGTAGTIVTELPHELTTETPGEGLPTLEPPIVEYPLRVSFVSPDGNLYTWTEGMGLAQLLLSDGDITQSFVSPDGTLIAFTRFFEYSFVSLEVINADGTNQHTLMDATQASALPRPAESNGAEPSQINWVPNSHTLALNMKLLFDGPGLAYTDNLYLLDADTGGSSTVLNTGSESWKFFYSPDGSKIAITLPTAITMYASDGTLISDMILYYDFVNTGSEYAWVASPVWSTDSLSLAAGIPPSNPFDPSPYNSRVRWYSYDGTSSEEFYNGPMPFLTANKVAFTSDFSAFLYYTQYGSPADNAYTLNVGYHDGTPSVEYVSGNFSCDPVWSPDNVHFFYSVGSGNTNYPYIGQIGTLPSAITDYTNAGDIEWIDANRYLVVSTNAGVSRLLLGTVGAPTGLIYDSVSPSSELLTFSVNR